MRRRLSRKQLVLLLMLFSLIFLTFELYITKKKKPSELSYFRPTPLKSVTYQSNNNTTPSSFLEEKEIINISALPVPEAFSLTDFYGEPVLVRYQWYFKPNKTKNFLLNYNFLKIPPTNCTDTLLVVMVMSLHDMTSRRQAIRDTWGSVSRGLKWPNSTQVLPVRVFFILGMNENTTLNSAVASEANIKKDIVIAEFDETYCNLTLKVLMAFKWLKQFCSNAKYIMKVDEDTFVKIPDFVTLIRNNEWENKIFGPKFLSDNVIRVGRCEVSEQDYPAPKYPPHVKGNCYFMPFDVAMKILAVSEYMPYVNMEDVEITGILAKIFNIRHVGLEIDKEYFLFSYATPCEFVTGSVIVSQQIFDKTMYEIWERMKNPAVCYQLK